MNAFKKKIRELDQQWSMYWPCSDGVFQKESYDQNHSSRPRRKVVTIVRDEQLHLASLPVRRAAFRGFPTLRASSPVSPALESPTMPTERTHSSSLKLVSLVTLTLQNAILGISMRYSRTRSGPLFISSTAVVMSEFVKLFTCLFLVYKEQKTFAMWKNTLFKTVIENKWDTLKVSVPSFVYIVQNNLLYVSASHLDAATYQVTYQLKILTTALLSVVMLRKKLSPKQWGSLLVLIVGVVMVQLSGSESKAGPAGQNRLIGFSAALGACVLSGFAGVYFEMILKGSNDVSVWMRNVQLSFLSLPLGFVTSMASDWSTINDNGWFYGYDLFVWYLVVLQAAGGLIVALVVKYADNILKGFATSLAIVISCVCSVYFFSFEITLAFLCGSSLVIASIFLYSTGGTPPSQPVKAKLESV